MSTQVNIGQIDIVSMGFSSTPLAGGASYIGDVISVLGYTHISGFVYSNVASATNGLIIEQGYSANDFATGSVNSSLITRSLYGISAGDMDNNAFAVQIVAPFARIIYTNGASAQTTFRLFFGARVLRGL